MHRYSRPAVSDPQSSRFDAKAGPLEAMYGLPREVRFCRKCVISNQRPNSAVEYQHTKDSRKQTIQFDAARAGESGQPDPSATAGAQ